LLVNGVYRGNFVYWRFPGIGVPVIAGERACDTASSALRVPGGRTWQNSPPDSGTTWGP